MVTVSGPKSTDHDRTMPDQLRDRSREKDAGDKQRSLSGRSDHAQRDARPEHAKDSAGERGRDTRTAADRQPVRTTAATTSDSRTKFTSASSASGQPTTSTQSRSSSGSMPVRMERAPPDKTTDKSLTKVSTVH